MTWEEIKVGLLRHPGLGSGISVDVVHVKPILSCIGNSIVEDSPSGRGHRVELTLLKAFLRRQLILDVSLKVYGEMLVCTMSEWSSSRVLSFVIGVLNLNKLHKRRQGPSSSFIKTHELFKGNLLIVRAL